MSVRPALAALRSGAFALCLLGVASAYAAPPEGSNNLIVQPRFDVTTPQFATVRVEVRGADLKEPLVATLSPAKDGTLGGLYVPPGAARTLHVTSFDERGAVVHEGGVVADVAAGDDVLIVVPMRSSGREPDWALAFGSRAVLVDREDLGKKGLRLRARVVDANGRAIPVRQGDLQWNRYGGPWLGYPLPVFDPQLRIPPQDTSDPPWLEPLRCPRVSACYKNICAFERLCVDPFVALSAGNAHTCAVRKSGILDCWGKNDDGQLGSTPVLGTCGAVSSGLSCRSAPTPVACPAGGACRFKQVSAGARHTCAIDTAGVLWCWGTNDSAQLAVRPGTAIRPGEHLRVLANALDVAAGGDFTCALRATSTGGREVLCWGANDAGQSGQPLRTTSGVQFPAGTTAFGAVFPVEAPAVVAGLSFPAVDALVAGARHACAIRRSTGLVRCWGDNRQQQVANGAAISVANISGTPPDTAPCNNCTTAMVLSSGPIVSGLGVPRIDVAGAGGDTTCFAFTQFSASCFGRWPVGYPATLAPPNGPPNATEPFVVRSFDASGSPQTSSGTISTVGGSTVGGHACAVTSRGTQCWGNADLGQLGDGTVNPTPFAGNVQLAAPVNVATTLEFTQVTTGLSHTCALTTDGEIACWGGNGDGQLGIGRITSREPQPTRVVN